LEYNLVKLPNCSTRWW